MSGGGPDNIFSLLHQLFIEIIRKDKIAMGATTGNYHCKPLMTDAIVIHNLAIEFYLKVHLRVRQFLLLLETFYCSESLCQFFCAPTNIYGFIGFQSCGF